MAGSRVSRETAALLMMKGVVSDLPAEAQMKVRACLEQLRAVVTEHGDEGLIALALLGLESSAKED